MNVNRIHVKMAELVRMEKTLTLVTAFQDTPEMTVKQVMRFIRKNQKE